MIILCSFFFISAAKMSFIKQDRETDDNLKKEVIALGELLSTVCLQ